MKKCSICITHVKANDPFDANERASETVYEILGLVNLARDRGKYRRRSYRTTGRLPVSEVLIGPHTTTHFANGALTHEGFWHENWVGGPNYKKAKGWERRYDQLSKGVAKSPWRDQCKSALARYYKAFSNPNLEESFLDGWRLFENTTGIRSQSIAEKINRASNVFGNNIEPRVIGKHLAHRRNLIAHGHAIKTDDDELLAFQMLQFIVHYMELFILNGFEFSTLKDFWEFFDLPNSKDARDAEKDLLKRRLSLLEKAAHFRRDKE